jgi:hypothetical protein
MLFIREGCTGSRYAQNTRVSMAAFDALIEHARRNAANQRAK